MSAAPMSKAQLKKETLHGYLFLLPSLIFFIGFVVIPMVYCVYISFFDSNLNATTQDVFIGLRNYQELFGDPVFIKALQNTIIIVLVSVPVVTIFSLWVSSVIFKLKDWALSAFRCIFYLPVDQFSELFQHIELRNKQVLKRYLTITARLHTSLQVFK